MSVQSIGGHFPQVNHRIGRVAPARIDGALRPVGVADRVRIGDDGDDDRDHKHVDKHDRHDHDDRRVKKHEDREHDDKRKHDHDDDHDKRVDGEKKHKHRDHHDEHDDHEHDRPRNRFDGHGRGLGVIHLLEAGRFKGVADARLRTLFPTPPSDAPADPNGAPLSPQDVDSPTAPAPTGADPAPAAPVEPAADGAPSAPQIHARVLAAFFADIRVAPTTSFDAII